MRDSSSPGAETRTDCVFRATFIKRLANSLEVARPVGRSAPTNLNFLDGPTRSCNSQQRRTRVRYPFWRAVGHFALYSEVLGARSTTLMGVLSDFLT